MVESFADRVYKYTADGVFLTSWDGSGTAGDRLQQPNGIDVDASEHVYVTDVGNAQIQKFTSTGGFLTKWGSSGSGDGQFLFPTDMAVDGDGNVYVVDQSLNRVQKFGDVATPVAPLSWGRLKGKYRDARAGEAEKGAEP